MFRKLFLKLKEKSSSLVFKTKHRSWFGFFLFLVILGLFFPISSAKAIAPLIPIIIGIAALAALGAGLYAGFYGGTMFTTAVTNVVMAFVSMVLQIPLLISGALLGIAILLLGLVTNPNFISLSYTKLDNPIIEIGWTLTRDLTNMGFVIILVIIALATALRIGEYQWQKTLPLLIVIALLINFTPVILGLIVDASNIVMYFFIGDMIDFSFLGEMFAIHCANIVDAIGHITTGVSTSILAQTIALMTFAFVSAFTFFAFAILFFLRYIAIWMLVILSPIAFAAYILPKTRGVFNMWWNQFIQWCFIGVLAAFFLYLTSHLLKIGHEGGLITGRISPPTGTEDPTGGLLDALIPYGIAIAFSIIGLFVTLSSSAMGASGVISLAQKGGRAVGAGIGKAAQRRLAGPAAGKTAGLIGAAARGAERLDKKLGILGTPLTKPLKWATRGIEAAAVSPLIEYAAKQRRITKPGGWDQMSIPEKELYVKGKALASDQLVLASEMKEEGTFQKSNPDFKESMIRAADKFKTDPRYLKEASNIFDALPDKVTKKMKIGIELAPLPGAERADARREIEEAINQIRDDFGVEESEAAGILHAQGLKPKDISEVAKSSLKSDVFRLATRSMKSSHLQTLRNSFDPETINAVLNEGRGLNTIRSLGEKKVMLRDNPDLVRWAYRTPAGRETLNWEKEWGQEEGLPVPADPRTPAPPAPTPGTPPSSKPPRGRPGDTGEAGRRGRREPDVGKP